MTKFTLLGVAAILSTTFATSIFAQTEPFQPQEVAVLDRVIDDAMAFAPPSRSVAPRHETTTRPWSAPVGHRQPRADQVPSEKNLGNPNDPVNKEDAALDKKIKSICRGC